MTTIVKDETVKKDGRGGAREGAGRPPKYPSGKMNQYTVRMPETWRDALVDEFGSFQAGIEALTRTHREKNKQPL